MTYVRMQHGRAETLPTVSPFSLSLEKKVGAIAIVNDVARRTRSAHHGCYCASGGVCEVNSEERRV